MISNLTLAPDFIRISAVFLLIKDAGLPVSMVALKNVLSTLNVNFIHLVFPVADLMTSYFLTAYSGLWPWLVFTTEGDMFNTEFSGSLNPVVELSS